MNWLKMRMHALCSYTFTFEDTSAAMIAVNLLSIDNVYNEYSAQFLVDNACPKRVTEQGDMNNH